MSEPSLTLLVVSDLHYTGLARQNAQPPHMRGELARVLLRKVFQRLAHMGVRPDLTVLLGDLIENGTDRSAELDLIALLGEVTHSGIPVLAVPGNHDTAPGPFLQQFACEPGLHQLGGYGFIVFADTYNDAHETTRDRAALDQVQALADAHPGLPLVALQHSPIYPAIDSHYPYRPTNAAEIIDAYRQAGVFLSLSGHFHKGQKARAHQDVLFHTVPALCEAPFRFSLVRLNGRHAEVEELCLGLSLPNLVDVHCHTEHAYCGTTVDAASCIALSQALGVSTLCLTEHAFQLYFDKKAAMSFKWQADPSRVGPVWQSPGRHRMAAYRRFAERLRSPFVKIGLEVDLFDNGRLLLAPEDAHGWDLLVGAIHAIQDYVPGVTPQAEAEALFLRDVTRLVDHPIAVLAHPFRFFARNRLDLPRHLFPTVAGLLADSGVAAEINFHTDSPDPEFIRLCVERGVKLALASDTHDLAEAGEFWPHVNVLRQAGLTPKTYPDVLFSF